MRFRNTTTTTHDISIALQYEHMNSSRQESFCVGALWALHAQEVTHCSSGRAKACLTNGIFNLVSLQFASLKTWVDFYTFAS